MPIRFDLIGMQECLSMSVLADRQPVAMKSSNCKNGIHN